MIFHIAYAIIWPIFHLLFPYKVIGKEKLNAMSDGYVLCSNHISLLDPVYIAYTLKKKRRIFFMAKQELFRNKVLAWFLKGVGAFPVYRGAGAATGLKTAENLLKQGRTLCVFPEGTRSKDGTIGKGKAGAAMLVSAFDTCVLPVTLITKNQKVRAFRKVILVIGDPVKLPPKSDDMQQRDYLRTCTAAIMAPIEEGLKQYVNER